MVRSLVFCLKDQELHSLWEAGDPFALVEAGGGEDLTQDRVGDVGRT